MKSTITRERLQEIAEDGFLKHGESKELARMALAAMDSEPVELPLDYLQGHKDGLEWAAQLAEANHPDTGDWLYDDPIELAKAIRKGPDMPPAQLAPVVSEDLYKLANHIASSKNGLPDEWQDWAEELESDIRRAAMLQAEPVTTANKLGNSPVIPDGYVMVPKEPTESMINAWLSEVANWRGHVAGYKAMLEATQPAPTIQVTNAMAYAFHHALTDGPLGDDDVEDIKTGLRSAFANVSTNQSVLVVPDRFIFEKWWETQNGSPLDGWDSLRTTDGYCDEVIDGQFEAWRACRSAMCATDKSSNHADCQSKLIKNCASGASAKQHG